MSNFKIENTFILDAECDLVILPLYITPKIKEDPLIQTLIHDFFPNKEKEILDGNPTPGKRYELYDSNSDITYWLYAIPEKIDAVISSLLIQIKNELSKSLYHNIAISQFGISEYGFDETSLFSMQISYFENYAKEEKKKEIHFYRMDDSHRLHFGEHQYLEESILDGKPDIGLAMDLTRKEVIINEKKVENYIDYFDQYIELRTKNKDYISSSVGDKILDKKTFLKVIRDNFYAVTHKRLNYSKWSHTDKKKTSKYYCQAPCKQTLKYLVLVLDMSEQEAKSCFAFFGYGLSLFNREDALFLRILRKKRSPRDVDQIDKTLKHYYGKKASLYYTGK